MTESHSIRKRRIAAAILLLVILAMGLGMKFYPGPGRVWMNNHVAGVAYVVFWCVLCFAIRPQRRFIPRIVLGVFIITCTLELLQMWRPALLESIRSTFVGRTLIGSSFDPFDFVYYIIGAIISWLTLHLLDRCAG